MGEGCGGAPVNTRSEWNSETRSRSVGAVRIASFVAGVIAILVGAVWILQGSGVLPGSFMTGQTQWLVIGILVAGLGLGLTFNGLRSPAKP